MVSLSSAHDGGGEPLVPDCRVRVVFRSVSSKAAASSYGAAGAAWPARPKSLKTRTPCNIPTGTDPRARAPLAHLHIHTYTYTRTRTPHTPTNTYTRSQTHIHIRSHETICARAHVIHARDTRTPEETPIHVHGYRHPAYMHVRTRPRNAHTRSRIYTYALRTRRTKRRGAARPRTWCTTRWTEDRAESWVRWQSLAAYRHSTDGQWLLISADSWIESTWFAMTTKKTFAEDNVIPRRFFAISTKRTGRPSEL